MDETDRTVGIAEAAAATGVAPDTLRYFEREGIVPPPRRDAQGRRRYTPSDLDTIAMLVHLRDAGMPLADIAAFTGHDSRESRLALLKAHESRIHDQRLALDRAHVQAQLDAWANSLAVIDSKINDYTHRLAAEGDRGTTS